RITRHGHGGLLHGDVPLRRLLRAGAHGPAERFHGKKGCFSRRIGEHHRGRPGHRLASGDVRNSSALGGSGGGSLRRFANHLATASRITLPDLVQGDRAFIRGHLSADQTSTSAVAVIIMTKAELAKKHERDREEWRKRGLAGTVTALNPEAKEVTISARTREGTKPMVVEAKDSVEFRRYAPDSVRFSDAKTSSFDELKIGDQLRVLGDKNADAT